MSKNTGYIGRFAPSPSGPLHFGSLVAAVASYLDARHQRGQWLLRMEDLDPAREPPEAADLILHTLEVYGLHWDGTVLYQSQRLDTYSDALSTLEIQGRLFPCQCTRQQIQAEGGAYDGRCRDSRLPREGAALRVRVDDIRIAFEDRVQGPQHQLLLHDCGDFVLMRKDGLFAYQLAVVVDDMFQDITDIVRGADLLDSTPRQLFLQSLLGATAPRYAHVPVVANEQGQKLSKQHLARPLSLEQPVPALFQALGFLGQQPDPELASATVADVLAWSTSHWDIQAVPKLANIRLDHFA